MADYLKAHPDVRFFLVSYGLASYEIRRVTANPYCTDTDRFSDAKALSSVTVARFARLDKAQAVLDLLTVGAY